MIPTIIEGFDYGIAVPSCYLLGFVDHIGNVFVLDGFYEKEMHDEDIANQINVIRKRYRLVSANTGATDDDRFWVAADPSIFRRQGTVGPSLASRLEALGIYCFRGNNDIADGIAKVQGYIKPRETHRDPFTGNFGAPYLYVSESLPWLQDEFLTYMWKKSPMNVEIDKPVDKNDHALDTLKYMLSDRPQVATLYVKPSKLKEEYLMWSEKEAPTENVRAHRYG
jgi:hypothetical protein